MKRKIIIICLIFIILYGIFCYSHNINNKEIYLKKTSDSIDKRVDLDNGEEKVDWDSFDIKNIRLNRSLEITKSGIYNLSGSLKNGNITINTTGDVKLVFNNISIKNNDGPAINVSNANNVIIELNGVNKLEDGSTYSNVEYDGCIYSKDDIVFQGLGTLEVIGNYMDGIVSSNDIKFVSGTYNIKSNGDGIRGKDSVYIVDGNFNITSGNDGIKSTTTDDVTKGFINIDNGNITINSKEDGIQAETKLIINNGNINVITNKNIDAKNNVSSKGLKSKDKIVINNGNINIHSTDDGIHSNKYIRIVNGKIIVYSDDDGIHANEEIIIDGGEISIEDSYEGFESKEMTINSGNISIVSRDDGINIRSADKKREKDKIITADGGLLHITGGKINIDSSGDGIDSNGKIIVSGGEIIVNGPTKNLDIVAFDYDMNFEVLGGKVFGVSVSPVGLNVSRSSSQTTIMLKLKNNYTGIIKILDINKKQIISYNPNKKYNTILISNDLLKIGEKYYIEINGKIITQININNIVNNYDDNN